MKNILEQIVARKRQEVAMAKEQVSPGQLQRHPGLQRQALSLKEALVAGSGVIAEFKRASPSKGLIRKNARVADIVRGYQLAGAAAVSVLTDRHFFQAWDNDLAAARKVLDIPVLRKEFIIDAYQVFAAKAMGADAILLIAAILSAAKMQELQQLAADLGLEVLVEVHNARELDKLSGQEQMVGVNNRDLSTFTVDITTSIDLAAQLGGVVKVTESGLDTAARLGDLVAAGYHGFLVGESFMRAADPGMACSHFVNRITALRS